VGVQKTPEGERLSREESESRKDWARTIDIQFKKTAKPSNRRGFSTKVKRGLTCGGEKWKARTRGIEVGSRVGRAGTKTTVSH